MGNVKGVPHYRHKLGVKCGSMNRSVHRDIYEADFAKLVNLLTVGPETLNLMTELAIQAEQGRYSQDIDLEAQKQEAIALCNRRIDAVVHLYKDGEIGREEYLHIRDTNEREIVQPAHWRLQS
jgi:hypothetical protein